MLCKDESDDLDTQRTSITDVDPPDVGPTQEAAMPVATPEVYGEMLDRAKSGAFAYPAINVTS